MRRDSRVNRRDALMLAVVSLACLSGLRCERSAPAAVAPTLKKMLDAAPDDSSIDMRDATAWEWTTFVALGPYTEREEAERALGRPWPDYEKLGLALADSFSLVAFSKGDEFVRVEKVKRCSPDFAEDVLLRTYTPESARFVIRRSNGCDTLYAE